MILLGLGTNLGDKASNLEQALAMLEAEGVMILRRSSIYQTPPWGILEQDSFLNMVVEVNFEGKPLALLEIALGVEEKMGRVREKKWGPRLIDIDLLEFNRTTIDHERLQLPHPFYPKRVFVLAPLAELESEWIPTGHQQTVSELLAAADTQGLSRWQAPNP